MGVFDRGSDDLLVMLPPDGNCLLDARRLPVFAWREFGLDYHKLAENIDAQCFYCHFMVWLVCVSFGTLFECVLERDNVPRWEYSLCLWLYIPNSSKTTPIFYHYELVRSQVQGYWNLITGALP